VLVNGLRGNVALAIKKIAELVRDLWRRWYWAVFL
jgi:hypothetical protein